MTLEDDKLYVRVTCSICRGKNSGCPYCDSQGKHYIEATVKKIEKWLSEQNNEDKVNYKKALEEKCGV